MAEHNQTMSYLNASVSQIEGLRFFGIAMAYMVCAYSGKSELQDDLELPG